MAEYATPFLVLNLGAEMVFVVSQRLEAQNVPSEKATAGYGKRVDLSVIITKKIVINDKHFFQVLEDIIYNLIAPDFFTEIGKPQEVFDHKTIRTIIEDVAQSSAMRLDPTSLDRLWDLITVVFKWQVTLSHQLIKTTLRHLYELETFTVCEKTQLQLHRIQNTFENFDKIFTLDQKDELRQTVLFWLSPFKARISLLLRLGLQAIDGSFVANNSNPIAQEMLRNLGENIYSATQNGKIMDRATNKGSEDLSNELQVFADQILGNRKLSNTSTDSGPSMKLMIDDQKKDEVVVRIYDDIDVAIGDHNIDKILNDMNLDVEENDIEENNVKDELLSIIGTEEV